MCHNLQIYKLLSRSRLLLLLVLLAFRHCFAAQPYRGRYSDPKCTDAETGRELYIGEAFTRPGQCVRVQCLGSLHIWEDTCQRPTLEGNCNRIAPANEYLDYPKCCPLYECKTYKTNEYGEIEETRTYDQYGTLRKTHIRQVFTVKDTQEGQVPGSGVHTQFEI